MLTPCRTPLVALAILVAVFVALYPYLGGADMCDHSECPYAAHSASGGFSTVCLIAVLAVVPAVRTLAKSQPRGATLVTRPVELFLSPDPPPPRIS